MKHVFIDTSVLYAACSSVSGASARLLQLCRQNKVHGTISHYVVKEIKKNVEQDLDEKGKHRLNFFLVQSHLHIIENPKADEVEKCMRIINAKDAPILASAIKCKATHLVTLNTRDFMQPHIKYALSPMQIVTPRDFVSTEV